jgi:ribonuclease P/MRP protein subunit RPP40
LDKVPKERLLAKLCAHGISGEPLAWIESWLSGRRQRVVINGEESSWEEVLSGVPQESVLGPPLFTVFINDLDEVIKSIELLKKFADDTKLGQTATPEGQARMQEALDKLCE